MSTYPNAYTKVKKLIFDVQYPGNWFEFGIIEYDFWTFTIWTIQIQVSFPEFENPKNPGIQPKYGHIQGNDESKISHIDSKVMMSHSKKSFFQIELPQTYRGLI